MNDKADKLRDLRLKIARALGWTMQPYRALFRLCGPDGVQYPTSYLNERDGWKRYATWLIIPDWPADAGAALALVQQTLDKLNAQSIGNGIATSSTWEFRMTGDGVALTEFGMLLGSDYGGYEVKGRDAEALARLAHAALEAEGE